jgi:hypothetical protein
MIDARRSGPWVLYLCQQSRVKKPAKGGLYAVATVALSA